MRRTTVLTALLAALLSLAGCGPGARSARERAAPAPVERSEYYLRARFGHDVRALLYAARFDRLQDLADSLERQDVRWPSGRSKLAGFYEQGFAEVDAPGPAESWERHLASLREWTDARPNSAVARFALVEGLTGRAWAARGHGWARTVSQDRWRRFGADLEEAGQRLRQCPASQRSGYGWYATSLDVLHGAGPEADSLYRLVALEAIERFPAQPAFYLDLANHLLPRWYGLPGEWKAFADTASAALPDSIADEFYARIVLMAAFMGEPVFDPPAADWPRVQRGLDRWIERWPMAFPPRGGRALLAWMADDRPVATSAFRALRDTLDSEVWGRRERYWMARRWVAEARD